MKENKKNISEIRKEYKLEQLDKVHIKSNPIEQLDNWVQEAIQAEVLEPTAMTLSTISKMHRPSSRILLLKGISKNGLVFFTNYESRKGQEISLSPFGAINFFWPELERQVRIEGTIDKVSPTESDEYFASRPRGSQIGAIVSPQSKIITNRDFLESKVNQITSEFEGKEIIRPSHWGGYILQPDYFEFWQGRPSRLHDRIIYTKENENWKIDRLAP